MTVNLFFPSFSTHRGLQPGPPADGKAGLYARHFSDLRDTFNKNDHLKKTNKAKMITNSNKRK